jgi:putative hydrolase of the HAD superfamily
LSPVRALIFDLDNTLYDESQYVTPAFHCISSFLSSKSGISERRLFDKLTVDLKKKGSMYPKLFNDVLKDLGLDSEMIHEVLSIYANVDAKLDLFPDSERVLTQLKWSGKKLCLVTNGGAKIQRNKLRHLNVARFFDEVVFSRETNEAVDKPHPAAYKAALDKLGVLPCESLCVGDNPYTDFWGAKCLGMRTARLLWGEFKDAKVSAEYEADYFIESLSVLLKLVEELDK